MLLACEDVPGQEPGTIHLLKEAFSIADPDVRQALEDPVRRLTSLFRRRLRDASVWEIGSESAASEGPGFQTWHDSYGVLQWAEI